MSTKKFLILAFLLIFSTTNTFAKELDVKAIEKPINFTDLENQYKTQEELAIEEFNALLLSTDEKMLDKPPIDITNTKLIDVEIPSSNETETEEVPSIGTLKEEITKTEITASKRTLKEILKGEKAPDAIMFAMYSIHTSDDKETKNNKQDLLGFQRDGKVLMYFRNSFYHSTVVAGLSRDVYRKQLTSNTKFDFGYKAGFIYGYHDKYPNLLGVTPAVLPMIGLSYKGKGIDMYIVPDMAPTFIFNVRIELSNKKV